MNVIDFHVTEVLSRREFDPAVEWGVTEGDSLYGKTFVEFKVKGWDDGGVSEEVLYFEKGKEPDIKPGYVFQH